MSEMTHADYLQEVIAEIAEELPGFDRLDPAIQQSLRELAHQYFEAEWVPRLEGMVNIDRYEEAMHERTERDRVFIEEQSAYLRTAIVKAQRAAHRHLCEKYAELTGNQSVV